MTTTQRTRRRIVPLPNFTMWEEIPALLIAKRDAELMRRDDAIDWNALREKLMKALAAQITANALLGEAEEMLPMVVLDHDVLYDLEEMLEKHEEISIDMLHRLIAANVFDWPEVMNDPGRMERGRKTFADIARKMKKIAAEEMKPIYEVTDPPPGTASAGIH